jgi:glutamate N-acetyltransferase/amino-acid N-acetyltransferase
MIAPNMATMLSVIMTDVAIEAQALKLALSGAVEQSFNRITIDGDRSTNDTAIVLANGLADNAELTRLNNSYPAFCDALTEVCYGLSHDIVRDGEGATKVIEVVVNGARSDTHARRAAMGVANSLLVKTAVYGADPNWGRILAAVGAADVMMSEERTEISIGRAKIFAKGKPTGKLDAAKQALAAKEVTITVNLGMGTGACKVLTCDLTEGYIKINAEYTT